MSGIKRSFWLTDLEHDLAKQIAEANGTSVNFVMRVGLRSLAGLAVPRLRMPDEEPDSLGEQVGEGVTAA